jgi:hypothetical protein
MNLRAFLADAVDVGRFSNYQGLMVDARLHSADDAPAAVRCLA